jgi:Ni/Co efflux regulator RcnB
MKKLLTLVFAIALTGSTAMFAQDTTTGTTTDTTTNKPQEKQGDNSKAKRQHVKTENGSEQREMRTNGNVVERRESKKLKNGKVVTRKQRKHVKQ